MAPSVPPNYTIAISSVSGGGKTTLVKRSAELLEGTTLFFDDYASVSEYPTDIKKWVGDGADVNEWKTPRFAQDLAALRRGESIVSPVDGGTLQPAPFIVIEEPMGRQRAEMAPLIDFVAVIEAPLEIALTRRLLRDLGHIPLDDVQKASKEELAEGIVKIVGYLKGYLSEYLEAGRDLYIAVQEQAKTGCDLVLDGTRPIDELAQQLVTAVKQGSRAADPVRGRPIENNKKGIR